MKESNFPKRRDAEKVLRLIRYDDEQTEDEAIAEDEAAFEDQNQTVTEVPSDLVPAVRALIAKQQK